MVINVDKTKVMLFNKAMKTDFLPAIQISNEDYIEVVEEMKLLGIIMIIDLKWTSNTQNLIAKGFKTMWMLRNLKQFGTDEQNLLEVYIQQTRRG